MAYFLQQVLNGVHMGAIYALLAFGYAISHGVLRRSNLAHGAVFAFTGQATILLAAFGWNVLWLTLPASMVFAIASGLAYAGLAGSVLARNVLRPLAGTSPNTIVAATLGAALVLGELARIAAETRDYWLPPMLAIPVTFWVEGAFSVTLTLIQLVNIGVILATIALAVIWLRRSNFGKALRAVSDDPLAAALCGVDPGRIFTLAIVASALAAGLAGILAAVHFGNISFDTGLFFGLKVLFIAAVGGYGAPLAAAAGAAAVGMCESLWTGYFPSDWRDAAVFLGLIALLVLRPNMEMQSRPG